MSRLLTIYKAYGWAWIIAYFVQMLWIYESATVTGLRTGIYVVILYTNQYGEHYFELIGGFLAVPAFLLIVYEYLKQFKKTEAMPSPQRERQG